MQNKSYPTKSLPTEGYIKVRLDWAPTTNGKKFRAWCDDHGFVPLNGGRRAWSSSLATYLRDASGIAYADGEPFLFYAEDVVTGLVPTDLDTNNSSSKKPRSGTSERDI